MSRESVQYQEENESSNWWLRLTAPPGAQYYDRAPTREQRERLRKGGLVSGVVPFVFFGPLVLVGQASDAGTLFAIVGCMFASIIAIFFNRAGKLLIAALLLIFALDVVIENGLISAPGGLGSAWLLSFDLFLFPLFLPGMFLDRKAIWFFLILHCTLILSNFFLMPHASDLNILVHQWGQTVAFARPLLLECGIGLLCFFQVRSTDQAIQRADRAEEVAKLKNTLAEQKERLEVEIQKLSEVLSEAANGRFNVRAEAERGNILWTVAFQLNNLLTRLQGSRQLEAAVRQTEVDLQRLTDAIRIQRQGGTPIWPLPNGGMTDALITELRKNVTQTRSPRFPE